jgi:hypothetical protein
MGDVSLGSGGRKESLVTAGSSKTFSSVRRSGHKVTGLQGICAPSPLQRAIGGANPL